MNINFPDDKSYWQAQVHLPELTMTREVILKCLTGQQIMKESKSREKQLTILLLTEKLQKLTGKKVKLKEDVADDSLENDLDIFFAKLVGPRGVSDTIEGEMIRAIMRIWYRYSNDGDYFFRGYGKQTAGSSATYLKTKTPISKQLNSILSAAQREAGRPDNDDEYTERDGYLNNLKKAAKVIIDYVKSKNDNYTPNPGSDSRI